MRAVLVLAAALAACAEAPVQVPQDSVVPGTIGVIVRQQDSNVVIASVAKSSSDVRVGDVVLRYNGAAITSPRQFYRLVFDSPPGSIARLEVLREGAPRTLEIPVRELDLMPRA
jgi:S1-C subfamily serine protease